MNSPDHESETLLQTNYGEGDMNQKLFHRNYLKLCLQTADNGFVNLESLGQNII